MNTCIEVITDTIKSCQVLCQNDPACNFFVWAAKTFTDSKNKCCLKDQVSKKIDRKGVMSGPKFCSGKLAKCNEVPYKYI